MESEGRDGHVGGLAAGLTADGRLGRSAGVLEVGTSLEGHGLVGSAGGRGVDVDGGQVGANLLVDRVAHLSLALQRFGQLGAQSAASFTGAQLKRTRQTNKSFLITILLFVCLFCGGGELGKVCIN